MFKQYGIKLLEHCANGTGRRTFYRGPSRCLRIFFQLKNLYPEQKIALKNFFLGKNIFFSAGTGYGKSLVFQAIPLMADLLADQVVGTSIGITTISDIIIGMIA